MTDPGVDAALRGGRAPAESQLQMLAQCAQKMKDELTYEAWAAKAMAAEQEAAGKLTK